MQAPQGVRDLLAALTRHAEAEVLVARRAEQPLCVPLAACPATVRWRQVEQRRRSDWKVDGTH